MPDLEFIDVEIYYPETPLGRLIKAEEQPLTPEQHLLCAMILDAIESYQKSRDPQERRWLLTHGMYLMVYLPTRLQKRRRLRRVIAEIDEGNRFNFNRWGFRRG
nr:hypothetical protein 12 [Desulfobulbaceae bacterium]